MSAIIQPEIILSMPWLPASVPAEYQLACRRSFCDYGIRELRGAGVGPNRGRRIDEYNTAARAPLGAPYCASSLTFWWRYARLEVPPHDPAYWRRLKKPLGGPASVDHWVWWAMETGRFTGSLLDVMPGFAVVYGRGERDNPGFHIEIIWRNDSKPNAPDLLAFGGNTARKGLRRTVRREGEAFDTRWITNVDDPDVPILGYISPRPLAA